MSKEYYEGNNSLIPFRNVLYVTWNERAYESYLTIQFKNRGDYIPSCALSDENGKEFIEQYKQWLDATGDMRRQR